MERTQKKPCLYVFECYFYSIDVTKITIKPVKFSSVLIFYQHIVRLLTLMNAQYLCMQYFLTIVLTVLPILKRAKMMTKCVFSDDTLPLFFQNEISDLVRDLNYSKFSGELVASVLKETSL